MVWLAIFIKHTSDFLLCFTQVWYYCCQSNSNVRVVRGITQHVVVQTTQHVVVQTTQHEAVRTTQHVVVRTTQHAVVWTKQHSSATLQHSALTGGSWAAGWDSWPRCPLQLSGRSGGTAEPPPSPPATQHQQLVSQSHFTSCEKASTKATHLGVFNSDQPTVFHFKSCHANSKEGARHKELPVTKKQTDND